MSRHRYYVIQRLPWIDGGHPGPDLTWIGGTALVYERGTTILLDDREVIGVLQCLEATDDDGRRALERARAAVSAPAITTVWTDFPPSDRAWLIRATDERLRQQGRLQELVTRMLERGAEPSVDDVVAARGEAQPPSKTLLNGGLRGRRRPGPKGSRRSTGQDLAIKAYYQFALGRAQRVYQADSRKPRAVADVAKRATAGAFGTSKRTVERVLAVRPQGLPDRAV